MDEDLPAAPSGPMVSIEDEMKRSYLDYAMSVIVGRALPDVRDGDFVCADQATVFWRV